MKPVLLIFIFTLGFTNVFAQPPNWDSVYADYFIKYQPVDTPAWLFPMCFKDYLGEWDTVYIGHDFNATSIVDTLLGERILPFDTSKFNAYLRTNSNSDSILKTDIENLSKQNYFNISFNKAPPPLTMYWNDNFFYSGSLPFPDLSPFPRARGDLWCNNASFQFPTCPLSSPLYMSDSSFNHTFLRRDSIFFDGDGSTVGSIGMTLYIVPFDKSLTAIIENKKTQPISVFPNPASSWIDIKSASPHYTLAIIDVLGKEIKNLGTFTNKENRIDVSFLPDGVYFLQVITEKTTLIKKILKAD